MLSKKIHRKGHVSIFFCQKNGFFIFFDTLKLLKKFTSYCRTTKYLKFMLLTFSALSTIILFMFLIRKYFSRNKDHAKNLDVSNQVLLKSSVDHGLEDMGEKLNDLVGIVDKYFEESEIYLNSKLSADLLGSLIKQNPRLIGTAIRYKYGISFRDYINNRRIQYIEDTFIKNNEFHKYSLDYIGEKAGFGTRQGFYIAFKKLKNSTPKEYFDKLVNA